MCCVNRQVLLVQTTSAYWQAKHASTAGSKNKRRRFVDKKDVERDIISELQRLAGPLDMPRPARSKLINWRTSQVDRNLQSVLAQAQGAHASVTSEEKNSEQPLAAPILTAGIPVNTCDKNNNGPQKPFPPLVLTGDWCVESSFEGCSVAAQLAAAAVHRTLP